MTESDPALSDTEAAVWAAIVESEWPDHSSEAAEPCDPICSGVTTYVPSRPSIAMMLMEVGCLLGAAVVLVSRMESELGPGPHAATLKHQLNWMIPAVIAMAVLAALISTRVCLFATYRLRLGAVRDVRRGAPDLGRTVRPPNPASVISWIGTLVTAMLVAAWWFASGLEGRSTRVGSLIVLDHVAPVLIVSLLAVIVGWLGITAWPPGNAGIAFAPGRYVSPWCQSEDMRVQREGSSQWAPPGDSSAEGDGVEDVGDCDRDHGRPVVGQWPSQEAGGRDDGDGVPSGT